MTSTQEILERYKNGERHFSELDIEGDLSKKNLTGISFDQCFIAADFRYCNLANSSFTNGNIKTSDFRYADLTNSKFQKLAIESTQFDWAKMDGIIFEGNYCFGSDVDLEDFFKLFKSK